MKTIFNTECHLTKSKMSKIIKIDSYVGGDDVGNVYYAIPVYTDTVDTVKFHGVKNGTNVMIGETTHFCYKGKLTNKLEKELNKIYKEVVVRV